LPETPARLAIELHALLLFARNSLAVILRTQHIGCTSGLVGM
jgi:hypothetical protein